MAARTNKEVFRLFPSRHPALLLETVMDIRPVPTHAPDRTLALPEEECLRRTTEFLTGPMPAALRTVEYDQAEWNDVTDATSLEAVARAEVAIRHRPGSSDAQYRIRAFGDELEMRLQLNVWRFVIVYTIPARELVDVTGVAPRFERWERGAAHAGWTIGWRDAVDPWQHDRQLVETYCYAMLPRDFLVDPMAQLYWRTDIMQMTRGFLLEAKRGGVRLKG